MRDNFIALFNRLVKIVDDIFECVEGRDTLLSHHTTTTAVTTRGICKLTYGTLINTIRGYLILSFWLNNNII